jgi:hypothetical protein
MVEIPLRFAEWEVSEVAERTEGYDRLVFRAQAIAKSYVCFLLTVRAGGDDGLKRNERGLLFLILPSDRDANQGNEEGATGGGR